MARDWLKAGRGLLRLRRDYNDTAAVFDIIAALEGPSLWRAYRRMRLDPVGRALIEAGEELSDRLMDSAWVASHPLGSVGAAYRAFLRGKRFNARVLADALLESADVPALRRRGAPAAWWPRYVTDVHDIAHVIAGYDSDPKGEGCLMAFTFAQLEGLGYAAIAAGSALLFGPLAVAEGYARGRRAAWLWAEDWAARFAEPLADVRRRLNVAPARHYAARLA